MQIFTKNQTEAIEAEIIPNVSKRVFVYTLLFFFFKTQAQKEKRQCRKQYKTWWIIFAILPI